MKGHETLIDMRRRGRIPAEGVHVDLSRFEPWFDTLAEQLPGHVTVWISPDDRIDRLDLRCFVGLHVLVCATDETLDRAITVAKQIAEHRAKSVQAFIDEGEELVVHFDSIGERAEGSRWPK